MRWPFCTAIHMDRTCYRSFGPVLAPHTPLGTAVSAMSQSLGSPWPPTPPERHRSQASRLNTLQRIYAMYMYMHAGSFGAGVSRVSLLGDGSARLSRADGSSERRPYWMLILLRKVSNLPCCLGEARTRCSADLDHKHSLITSPSVHHV